MISQRARTALTAGLLALRFVLELALLGAAAWIGWRIGNGGVTGAVMATSLVLATAILWGVLLSPKARVPIPLVARIILEIGLFLAAGLALGATGEAAWALALMAGEAIVLTCLLLLGERPGRVSQ